MASEEYSERLESSMADAVEEFIQVNEVDGSAADALRECTRTVQAAVIDRGGLSGARNPSSVLLARIRDASAPPLNETDMDQSGFVRLRGIPFSASTDDIVRFFDGLSPLTESVVIGTTREGRLSGEAFVQFPSVSHAKEAIEQRHRATMGDRYIELFPSTPGEAQRAEKGEPRHGSGWDRDHRHDDRSSHYWSNSASDRTASADEVEQFLSSSTIDDHAQTALRELSPYMQAAVIDRGGLGNARNPSSVLLSRIRDVQNGVTNTPPPPPPSGSGPRGSKAERVERFLEESQVDEQAAEVFRNCHPDVQEEVMSRPVSSARNPSSALRARIRDVEQTLMTGGSSQAPSRSNLTSAVEDFIQQNGIDERAADALRNSQPRVQEAVLDRGDFVGVRNPSSAVLARIRAADAKLRGDDNNADRDNYGYHDDGYSGGRSRDGRPYSIEDAVEEFIRANYLDERASEALRGCPPQVQEEVLHRGDLAGTRNPSSALVARLKDIQGPVSGPGRGGRGGGGEHPPPQPAPVPVTLPGGLVDDIEYLLRLYAERDDRAADALGRLRSVKYSMGDYYYDGYGDRPPGPPPPTRSRSYSPRGSRRYDDRDRLEDFIDGFVRTNGIDAKAADALRRADPRTAYMVMEKGVSGARNPSSALLARLRDMESYGAPSGRERYDPEPPPRKRGRLEDDVEAFIRANGVDDMAADTLRRCSPELQEVVMEKGVAGARNPSSALLARIRDLDGRMGGGGGGGGDRRSYGGNAPPRRGGDRYAPY